LDISGRLIVDGNATLDISTNATISPKNSGGVLELAGKETVQNVFRIKYSDRSNVVLGGDAGFKLRGNLYVKKRRKVSDA